MRDWLERRQITVYLGAIGLGIAAGSIAPDAAGPLEFAVTPVLAALIYTTFLQVPLADLRGAMRNRRFSARSWWPISSLFRCWCGFCSKWCRPARRCNWECSLCCSPPASTMS